MTLIFASVIFFVVPLRSQTNLLWKFAIQLFEGKKVRIVWDEEQEKYFLGLPQILICGKRRQPPDCALGAKKHNHYICCRGSDLLIMDCRFRRRANKRDRKSVDRR